MFSSPSSKVIKTVGRKTFFAWDEDTVTSILHAQEIDRDDGEDMRVWSRFFAPSFTLQNVRQLESLEVERVEIPSDAVYCEWERTKDLVAASEQSRSGDGIASAGATSGESIKRKNGEISDSEMLHLFPNRN